MGFDASREGQLTEQGFKWSIWWVNNKIKVRAVFSLVLGLFAMSLLGYGAYGFADYYLGSGVEERANLAEQATPYINYAAIRKQHAPKSLVFEKYAAVPGTSGVYDAAATAVNPNTEWIAEFSYSFRVLGAETKSQTAFVLPGDTVWLYALNVKSASNPGIPELVMGPVTWKRVDFHDTRPDYVTWAKERLGFSVADAKYVPPLASDPLTTSRASFRLDNLTAFSYHNVSLTVTLWSGTKLVGINRITLGDYLAGERRQVEAVWFHDVPGVTDVQVDPVIDIFSPTSYITPDQAN